MTDPATLEVFYDFEFDVSLAKPAGDRIMILLYADEQKTGGGLILPDSARRTIQDKGLVVGVGEKVTLGIKVGDHISAIRNASISIYSNFEDKTEEDGPEYRFVREGEIIAIWKEGDPDPV